MEGQLWYNVLNHIGHEGQLAAQAIGLYQKSRCNENNGSYFLLNCKDRVVIAGDAVVGANNNDRNVRAEWLGLPSTFSGTMTVHPQQVQYGALFEYFQDFKKVFDHPLLAGWWLWMSVPVVTVKNNLHLTQLSQQSSETPGPINSIATAFNNPSLAATKMSNRWFTQTCAPEITLNLGATVVDCNDFHFFTYSGFTFPTVSATNFQYLFKPVAGTNGHVTWNVGLNLELPLHEECAASKTHVFLKLDNRYYIAANQCKTFDLKGKPWSRYLQVRRQVAGQNFGEAETIFAANVLTFVTRIHPYSYLDLSTGLKWRAQDLELEIGYDLWYHNKERICIRPPNCFTTGYAFQEYGIAGTGTGSASDSTIQYQAANDTTFTTITLADIDVESAAAPYAFVNRMHIALGYQREHVFLGAGFYYESPETNTALTTLGVWAKLGCEF